METTMSHDYRFLLGKISMDLSFAKKFFSSTDEVLKNFSLSQTEQTLLRELSIERFNDYCKALNLRNGDCDGCCNGGDPSGNCCECSASCCQ